MGNPIATYDLVSTRLAGTENFKSYALDSDIKYLALTQSKAAIAFSGHQYVNIVRDSPEELLAKSEWEAFRIESGEMFNDDTYAFECLIDSLIADERNLKVGSTINIYLNDFQYELRIAGIYGSCFIDDYLKAMFNQGFITNWVQPNFLDQLNSERAYYLPSIYVNAPFYEEAWAKKSVGLDLDFYVVGLPSDEIISDFVSGDKVIAYGRVFDPASDAYECIISEDLAKKNEVKVGDEITLQGCFEASKDYNFKIVGIYYDTSNSSLSMDPTSTLEIPLDTIYMSSSALMKIVNDIESYTPKPYPTAISLKLVFQTTQDMNDFYRNVTKYDYKLREKFFASSQETQEYFNQLTMIKRTTSYALITFVVELAIAIIFLFMFNAYNLRERQYEIGVLTSMGMSKAKIAIQFFSEIIIVVLTATLLGSALGTIASETTGNYLTKQNIESREVQRISFIENFGREVDMPYFDSAQDPTIDASVNLTTLLWLWAAFTTVTVIATSGTVSFILSFEPITILNDRQ